MKPLLDLLMEPRESLAVLEHVARGGTRAPGAAARELRIGINTWYLCTKRLEDLGLLAITRAPGGKKAKSMEPTERGLKLLTLLKELPPLLEGSRAALEFELEEGRLPTGSARAGEVLFRLVEIAERNGDFGELARIARRARALKRPGEARLASATKLYLEGYGQAAGRALDAAMKALAGEPSSGAYLRALYLKSGVAEHDGNPRLAYILTTELRQRAKKAGNLGMEAEANLGLGILKTRSGQSRDGAKYMARAAEIARRAGLPAKESKILANLAFAEFFLDLGRARATADRALAAARRSGARVVEGRAQINRALILAAQGEKRAALEALSGAREIYREGGEERGREALEDWAALVRGTLRRRPGSSLAGLRGRVLALVNQFPSQKQARPPGKRRGRSPKG